MNQPKPFYTSPEATLYNGDCLDILETLIGTNIDAVVTDPPYGIALQNHDTTQATSRRGDWNVPGDAGQGVGQAALDICERMQWPTCAFASPRKPWRGLDRNWLVWDKGAAVGGGGDVRTCWKRTWELIQIDRNGRLQGGRDPSVLRYPVRQNQFCDHPTQKPVDLLVYLIEKLTDVGETVLDPFAGSGTTGVACVQTGRRFVGIEINKHYCAVAARRLAEACRQRH